MKYEINPTLLLHGTFYRGPLAVGLTWREQTQNVTIKSCEENKGHYIYEVEVVTEKKGDDGKTNITARDVTRFDIDPYLIRTMRIENGPYPYITLDDPKPGYTSVKYSVDSGEVYNEDSVLVSTVNLGGGHKPMFGYTKKSSTPKIKAVVVPPPTINEEEIVKQYQSSNNAIDKFLLEDSQSLRDYKSGKKSAIGGCMGLIMRSNKSLNPKITRKILEERLESDLQVDKTMIG